MDVPRLLAIGVPRARELRALHLRVGESALQVFPNSPAAHAGLVPFQDAEPKLEERSLGIALDLLNGDVNLDTLC